MSAETIGYSGTSALGGLALPLQCEPDLVVSSGPAHRAKHFGDRLLAALLLVVLSPVLLLLSVAVLLSGPGSVLFRQERVGRHGCRFTILKFRTMHAHGHAQRELLRRRDNGNGVLFKLHDDPRVTAVGRFLRRWSLDELPQLVNVLRGEMSLVGPRPALPEEVARYSAEVRRRLLVKPGLTGLWQVSGRSDLSWEESVRLDLQYVQNLRWSLDVAILVRTLSAVVTGRGAY